MRSWPTERFSSLGEPSATTTLVDDPDPISERIGLVEILRREEDGHSQFRIEPADLRPDVGPTQWVEPGGWFVEEKQFGTMDQGDGKVEPALHSARIGADPAIDGIADVDQVENCGHPVPDLGRRHAVETPLEVQDFASGLPIIERRFLQGDADAQPDGLGMAGDVVSGDEGNPLVWPQERAKHPNGGRLSRSVGSQEAVDLTLSYREVDTVDRIHRAKASHQTAGQDGAGAHLRFMHDRSFRVV